MKLKEYLSRLVAGLLLIVIVVPFPAVQAAAEFPYEATDEITTTATLSDGSEIGVQVIDGPPEPPVEFAAERAASVVTSLDRATSLSGFPSYDWVFGCSAVSAAMIAAYYDNNGYPNMYTGLDERRGHACHGHELPDNGYIRLVVYGMTQLVSNIPTIH